MTLKKDQKLGFGEVIKIDGAGFMGQVSVMFPQEKAPLRISGFVIVGEDNTGKLDLGIFIASIVPDGPADKDGRIKPGTMYQNLLEEDSYLCSLALHKLNTGLTFFFLFNVQVDVSFL